MKRLLVVPTGRGVGLTSICLGIVRALDRLGVRYAFCRPISVRDGEDDSSLLMARVAHLDPPDPIPRAEVERLLGDGQDDLLLERVVETVGKVDDADVVVVEGAVPVKGVPYAARINIAMAEALDAEIVLVGAPLSDDPQRVAEQAGIAAQPYAGLRQSCILNRVPVPTDDERVGEPGAVRLVDDALLAPWREALQAEGMHPLGLVPQVDALRQLRVVEIARAIGARPLHAGDWEKRRVARVEICAASVRRAAPHFLRGTLLVVPGDRDDILLGVALASIEGVELAGVVLSMGTQPDPHILQLIRPALERGLPLLLADGTSYGTATALHDMERELDPDDAEHAELVMNVIATHLDARWLEDLAASVGSRRMTTPAFRHELIARARAADKRIVLPEGDEPRTVTAAAICTRRGIARCVLLGEPGSIARVARQQGVSLDGIEVIDPATVIDDYVDGLVERREHKGLAPQQARDNLGDRVTLGTMMLAEGHVDGLVSGAVHSTAATVRPALQLIRTAPGSSIVSSVFFMCLPRQVLVYGDCAVVPNPTVEQLAEIALQSAASAEAFGIEPRVAMISYSTGASGSGEDVEKVAAATALARGMRPSLCIDGPLQYDAAAIPSVAAKKAPDSPVAGKATVFVFPDLNTGNTVYKAVQRSAGVVSMGPMLQGLAAPVNDLSRGALVDDIVFTIALTAVQADSR